MHLAGIAKFKADEILIFSTDDYDPKKIIKILNTMGIPYRIISCKNSYLDCYRKANEEASAVFVDDTVVAINISTGRRIIQEGIEDGIRIQLFSFNRRVPTQMSAAAFRYEVPKNIKGKFPMAPIWNSYSKDHNDIFETIAEASKPMTMKSIWDEIVSGREDITFESFRKIFREFKRWFKNTPYFQERVKKGPEYKIKVD